jgi:NADH-quinone oxidoreductase subunit H
MAPALIVSAIVPFGSTLCWGHLTEVLGPDAVCEQPVRLQIARLDAGLLFYFAISSLAVYGATLAGWASHNKWAMMGGLRASSQMMSYEVTMGMAVLGSFLVFGTLEPGAIAGQQVHILSLESFRSSWGIFTQPAGFVLFLTAAIAETKRTPFDIPEGEPEIIGYFVEYSGIRWGMFFLAEFIEIVFISSVIATVFFGGWQVPFLNGDGFRYGGYLDQVSHAWVGGWFLPMPHWAVVALQFLAFGGKVVLLSVFQLFVRWTLPRFRADQLMNLGWKLLLPLALANIMFTALIKLILLAIGA